MTMATLGFTLRIAGSARDLQDAAALRAEAYGHHLPEMATTLAQPDAIDRQPGTVVLLCRDKATGAAVGTARIQRNHPQPLQIERSVALPEPIALATRAEITRLAVRPGADTLVRTMLVKACWLYAVAGQIRWLVIGARSEGLIRIYRHLGFADLLAEGERVPLAHAGNLPHRVLGFDVMAAERTWHAQGHALYPLMAQTWHPDLQLLATPDTAESAEPAWPVAA